MKTLVAALTEPALADRTEDSPPLGRIYDHRPVTLSALPFQRLLPGPEHVRECSVKDKLGPGGHLQGMLPGDFQDMLLHPVLPSPIKSNRDLDHEGHPARPDTPDPPMATDLEVPGKLWAVEIPDQIGDEIIQREDNLGRLKHGPTKDPCGSPHRIVTGALPPGDNVRAIASA